MKKLLVVLAVAALGACSQPTAPVAAKSAPTQVSNSRWILISGVWTCVEGCDEEPQ